jgi:hypothetical protein
VHFVSTTRQANAARVPLLHERRHGAAGGVLSMDTVYRRVLKKVLFLSPSHLKQMRSARAASLLH